MSQGERHELKFVLDTGRLAVAENWLYQGTDLRKSYESRRVNSLYFDDTCFSAVHDNLAGISARKKIRLRWYSGENERDISHPALEIKSRKNRVGRKEAYALSGLQHQFLNLTSDQFLPEIEKHLAETSAVHDHFDDFLIPSLQVSYQRDYFENDRGVRITFDRSIRFALPLPNRQILEGPTLSYPNIVMEVKFPDQVSDEVCRMIRPLPLSAKRHSKYLAGLASFGYVVYN